MESTRSAPPGGAVSPSLWYVPFPRNANFTGRDAQLDELARNFAGDDSASRTQTIYGLGGIGKTQLALEYAYRHRNEYGIVWWVRADEPSTMLGDFMALAPLLMPDAHLEEAPADVACDAVRRALDNRHDWLLILDNIAGPHALGPVLPQARSGHILITSRNPNWRGVGRPMHLSPLTRDESLTFLRRRTGLHDTDEAARLAEALGDLPLALEQAGACIEQSRLSFGDYLERFHTHRHELLRLTEPGTDYSETVATTWELSFERVRGASRTAGDLLNLISFFNPDHIERAMLTRGTNQVPHPLRTTLVERVAFDGAIAALLLYSLIDADSQRLSMHRLVSDVTRDRMPIDERRRWCEIALRLVNDAFAFESIDVGTWGRCAALLPHVLSVTAHAESMGVAPEVVANLLNETGRFLLKDGKYPDARDILLRAIELARRTYGEKHPAVSAVANDLGRVYQRLHDYQQARHYFEWALAIDEPVYGHNHPHVATVVNNYGMCLMATGNTPSAREHFEWALAVYEMHYGADHGKTASIVNNLGYVLKTLGDLPGAKASFERALTAVEANAGPRHPNVASILFNLGNVLRSMGDRAAAKPLLERALSITQSAFAPTHPDVVRDTESLASLLKETGDVAAARTVYERALNMTLRTAPPTHPFATSLRRSLDELAA